MPKKKTTRRRSKKRRPISPPSLLRWLLVLVFAGAVLGTLVLIARWEEQPPEQRLPPVVVSPESEHQHEERVRSEVEAFLASAKLSSQDVQRDINTHPYRYQVQGTLPSKELVAGLQQRLKAISHDYSVMVLAGGDQVVVERAGESRILIRFVPPPPVLPAGPKVAIIMDDLGRGLYPAQVLLSLAQPVTFSILPGESHAREVAEMARSAGREVMLHVPMEPQGYPAVKPGADALLVSYSDTEIRRRFKALLDSVPQAVGANNHMGSRFTEYEPGMVVVMEMLRDRGLFFVDSLTTGRSRGIEVADRFGVDNLKRDIFLDNVADVEKIRHEIRRLVARAKQNGYAVGLCHPYPETLEALRLELPEFPEHGVTMVSVEDLLSVVAD